MAPTLAFFGSTDPCTPAADIDALRAAWSGRTDCEIVVVEGAEHGFVHDPDRDVHRADDAAQAWEHALAVGRRELDAPRFDDAIRRSRGSRALRG